MNSYYSNRIEQQETHPLNIERALANDFSNSPVVAKRQRLAVAHIEAEKCLESQLNQSGYALSLDIAVSAHQELYGRILEQNRMSPDGIVIEGGAMRKHDLQIGRHIPPAWASVPTFIAAWDKAYNKDWAANDLLIVAACAHHRFT